MNSRNLTLIRNFIIEIVLYGIMVTVYLYLVISIFGDWLLDAFDNNLVAYAFAALILIVVQGVLFEQVTSFLVDRLGLERTD